jgi:hypothetical protein
MAKAKIVLTTPREELTIATFQNTNEAFICASILQAKVNSEEFIYYVDFKEKGRSIRRQPNSLRSVLGTLAVKQLEQISTLF